jgi:hypothetical protein
VQCLSLSTRILLGKMITTEPGLVWAACKCSWPVSALEERARWLQQHICTACIALKRTCVVPSINLPTSTFLGKLEEQRLGWCVPHANAAGSYRLLKSVRATALPWPATGNVFCRNTLQCTAQCTSLLGWCVVYCAVHCTAIQFTAALL